MKAAQINQYGGAELVRIQDAPQPQVEEDKVLVEVYAASLNPFDTTVREGRAQQMKQLNFPATLGGDIAGVVKELGQNVKHLKVGDKVFGQSSLFGSGSGAFAEFSAGLAHQIARMPQNLNFVEAAALPLTGASAIQALKTHINLKAGQKILIQGGSGGIGSMATQIAKHIGAYVAITVPTEALEYAATLGADLIIDYKTQDFRDLVHDYDAVFDTAGGEVFERSIDVVKKGGIAVSMIAAANEEHVKKRGITAITQNSKVTTERLDELRPLVESGAVTVHIEKVFPFSQVREAFQMRENETVRGKIVLEIKKEE